MEMEPALKYRIEVFALPTGEWYADVLAVESRQSAPHVRTARDGTCRQAVDAAAKWVHQHRIGRAPGALPAEPLPESAAAEGATELSEVMRLVMARGLGGYGVLNECGGDRPFRAVSLTHAKTATDPRSPDTHATPGRALAQLAALLRAEADVAGAPD